LFIIVGATDTRAPAALAPLAIGLTLAQFIWLASLSPTRL
jgi:glycerol uptake facilitator-like aquaporin